MYRYAALFLMAVVAVATTAMIPNIVGRVVCGDAGLSGVAVSDGVNIVYTDSGGSYALASDKREQLVFVTVPQGYEPTTDNGIFPRFWQPLTSADTTVVEQVDFFLHEVENSHCRLVVASDMHLARQRHDRALYKAGFLQCVKREKTDADSAGIPIYALLLGDLAWDEYWYAKNYTLRNFVDDHIAWGFPTPIYAITGNHDNDGATPAGPTADHDAAWLWRETFGPSYYAFNVGGVHVVMLDDVIFLNEDDPSSQPYPEGIVGTLNYSGGFTEAELEWLRQDLAVLSDSTTVFVGMHIPAWKLNSKLTVKANLGKHTTTLCNMLQRFKSVHLLTGHNHSNDNLSPKSYPNILEHNVSSVCGTFWLTTLYDSRRHLCRDGSPAGYYLWHLDDATAKWQYRTIETGGDPRDQMRITDMNAIRQYYDTCTVLRELLASRTDHDDYALIGPNKVLVNVYAYSTGWQVEMLEGDSRVLQPVQTYTQDPLHVLEFETPHFARMGRITTNSSTHRTGHIFLAETATPNEPVTVRITDSFGNIYTDRIDRPLPYDSGQGLDQLHLPTGDASPDGVVDVRDINRVVNLIINPDLITPLDRWLADIDSNGHIDIADLNRVINIILGNE